MLLTMDKFFPIPYDMHTTILFSIKIHPKMKTDSLNYILYDSPLCTFRYSVPSIGSVICQTLNETLNEKIMA